MQAVSERLPGRIQTKADPREPSLNSIFGVEC